jgi:hypothetical protein
MRERVNVTINKIVLYYDLLLIVGPTFPHEVVGFSGGNKYLIPGISGPEIIDMFHWLGALITNSAIIGAKRTPVRAIVDRAASMVPIERKCVSLVVAERDLIGLFIGTPERGGRSVEQGPYPVCEDALSKCAQLRAGDVRRALGRREMRVQARTGRRRRRRAHHLRASH